MKESDEVLTPLVIPPLAVLGTVGDGGRVTLGPAADRAATCEGCRAQTDSVRRGGWTEYRHLADLGTPLWYCPACSARGLTPAGAPAPGDERREMP